MSSNPYNFKSLLFNSIIVIAIAALFYRSFFISDKMAYVDSAKILSQYKGSADAKKAYQQKAAVWQQNIETLTKEVQSGIERYEKSLATAGKTEQGLASELIESKKKQLNDYQQSIRQNAREEDQKLTANVVSQINAFLTTYGKDHHYKMILIANQSGTIAYAREGLDISEDVIKEMNKSYSPSQK